MAAGPKVYIVDDDSAVRSSLLLLVRSRGFDVETYATASEFLELYDSARPGCLVLDMRMPGMTGLELQQLLSTRGIHIPIIFLTSYADVSAAVRAIKAGAMDLLEKPVVPEELFDRIELAIANDIAARCEQACRSEISRRFTRLTRREREVLGLVVQGKPSKTIASELGISLKTVAIHRARVMEKTESRSVAELVNLAVHTEFDGTKDRTFSTSRTGTGSVPIR